MANQNEQNDSRIQSAINMNKELQDLLRSESQVLGGDGNSRSVELLNIHNRYNELIQTDFQGARSSKDPNDSTYEYITNSLLGRNRNFNDTQKMFKSPNFTTGNPEQDKLLKEKQLDKLFTMGDGQISSYFLSTASNTVHIYDEIDSVCSYFYQLEEANLIIRDNVLRAEQVNEDISMNIKFPGVTSDTTNYVSIVKKALNYQNVSIKIRDHVVPKAIKYGTYYVMVVPYSEIGEKLIGLNTNNGYSGYAFYESTDTHKLFKDSGEDLSGCMEGVTTLFESLQEGDSSPEIDSTLEIIKENANNIFVCEDDSIPDMEGFATYESMGDSILKTFEEIVTKVKKDIKEKDGDSLFDANLTFNEQVKRFEREHPDNVSEPTLGGIGSMDDMLKGAKKEAKKKESNNINTFGTVDMTLGDLNKSKDILGCHIKLIDPRQMIPIKIFDYVVGYYYFENYDFGKMGNSISDIMGGELKYSQRSMTIDRIVDSVLGNLKYGDVLKGDNQLRSMVLNCILYSERRDNPIRIKFVRPDYIIPWKTNLDEHDNGQPVMTRALLYARLYTSLMLFYSTAIITKSTDSEFYYLKESALDGQMNNQISDMMDQLEDSNVDPIQIANGNILHGNRAINKRFYLNMGTSEIKPFEMDVVSGQNIDINTEFLNGLKKMAIGATSVPAVMVDYVDEIEYATMLGMANIKHLTRANSIKKDFNIPLTQTAKMIVRMCFPNTIPENILDKMEITLREAKIINNNTTNQQLNDNIGLSQSMVKTWLGGDNTNPPEIQAFVEEDMTRQLTIELTPSAPWEVMPTMYKKSLLNARRKKLENTVTGKTGEQPEE